jgi:hypothetical protein
MAEFSLPATPADGDLYNDLLDAEVRVAELRRQYHEAECRRLDDLWNASNSEEVDD